MPPPPDCGEADGRSSIGLQWLEPALLRTASATTMAAYGPAATGGGGGAAAASSSATVTDEAALGREVWEPCSDATRPAADEAVAMVARRPIAAGEELTFDYARHRNAAAARGDWGARDARRGGETRAVYHVMAGRTCRCGAPCCRGAF